MLEEIDRRLASLGGLLFDDLSGLKVSVLIDPVFKASPSKNGFQILLGKRGKVERVCRKRLGLAFDDPLNRRLGLRQDQVRTVLVDEGATNSVLLGGGLKIESLLVKQTNAFPDRFGTGLLSCLPDDFSVGVTRHIAVGFLLSEIHQLLVLLCQFLVNIVQFPDEFTLVLAFTLVPDAKDVFVDTLTVEIQLCVVINVVLDLIQNTLESGVLALVVKQVGLVSDEVGLKVISTELFGVVA